MAEVPTPDEEETGTKTVTEGYFEEELYVGADAAADFLEQLATQLRSSDEITLTGDGWEIPFAFGEPIELDIEFQGNGDPELEIELEIDGVTAEDEAPGVA